VKEFIEQFEQAKLEIEYLKKKKKWFVNETAMKMYLELKVNTDFKDEKNDKKFNLTWSIEEDLSYKSDTNKDNWIISKINDFAQELEKDLYEGWKENDSYKIEIKRKILLFLKDNDVKDIWNIANQIIDKL
jgi:DNA-dependent RNA polymerase auxiliary subunit epsilon